VAEVEISDEKLQLLLVGEAFHHDDDEAGSPVEVDVDE